MNPEETIAIYGSHDTSVTFIDNNNELRIYEYENNKNQMEIIRYLRCT